MYTDDNEYGFGSIMLEELKKQGIFNIAIYIARFYDGTHIGHARFDIARSLTQEALSSYPAALNYGHKFRNQALVKALGKAVKTTAGKVTSTDGNQGRSDAPRERGTYRGTGRTDRGRGHSRKFTKKKTTEDPEFSDT